VLTHSASLCAATRETNIAMSIQPDRPENSKSNTDTSQNDSSFFQVISNVVEKLLAQARSKSSTWDKHPGLTILLDDVSDTVAFPRGEFVFSMKNGKYQAEPVQQHRLPLTEEQFKNQLADNFLKIGVGVEDHPNEGGQTALSAFNTSVLVNGHSVTFEFDKNDVVLAVKIDPKATS
jgi:hypothetical protein